jgi:hypothetical protein
MSSLRFETKAKAATVFDFAFKQTRREDRVQGALVIRSGFEELGDADLEQIED